MSIHQIFQIKQNWSFKTQKVLSKVCCKESCVTIKKSLFALVELVTKLLTSYQFLQLSRFSTVRRSGKRAVRIRYQVKFLRTACLRLGSGTLS